MANNADMERFQRDEALRQIILEAARSILLDTGSTEFSMRNLVSAAALNNKTVYRLFPSKNAVLGELLRTEVRRFDQAAKLIDSDDSIRDLFRTIALSTSLFYRNRSFMRALTLCLFSPTNELQTSVDNVGMRLWRALMQRLVDDGALREDTHIDILAKHVLTSHIAIVRQFQITDMDEERFNHAFSYTVALACCAYASAEARERFLDLVHEYAGALNARRSEPMDSA